MILIQIGTSKQNYDDINNSWIVQQINNRKKEGVQVCVIVIIKHNEIDIVLSAGECPQGGSGGRKALPIEEELFELWNQIVLDEGTFEPQKLIQFLNKIKKYNLTLEKEKDHAKTN